VRAREGKRERRRTIRTASARRDDEQRARHERLARRATKKRWYVRAAADHTRGRDLRIRLAAAQASCDAWRFGQEAEVVSSAEINFAFVDVFDAGRFDPDRHARRDLGHSRVPQVESLPAQRPRRLWLRGRGRNEAAM